jgi:hypothetical protein
MEYILEHSANDEENVASSSTSSSNKGDIYGGAEHSATDFRRKLAADETGFERPKTSRGISHPSPDEFFNYVIPSPEAEQEDEGRGQLELDRKEDHSQHHIVGTNTSDRMSHPSDTNSSRNFGGTELTGNYEELGSDQVRHSLSEKYLLEIYLEGVSRDKQIALLGCWLFGSALRI